MFKNVFLLSLFCLFALYSISGTYYSDSGGGDPNDVNKWWTGTGNNGSHPSNFTNSSDVFVVQSGHSYTTTNAWNISGTLQVNGSLTIQTANSIKILTITSGGVLTASAQTTITASASGGQFNINNGGKFIFNYTTSSNASTLFNGTETFGTSSTVEFQNFETTTGGFALCLAASSSNFGNVIWNIQAGNTAYKLNNSSATTRTVAGDFTISATGVSGSLTWCNSANVGKLTISGNYTQTAGDFYVINTGVGGNGAIFEVLGNFELSGGTFDVGASFSYEAYTYIGGDFTMSGGTFTNSGPNTTNYVYFTKSGTQTFTQNSGTFTTTSTPFVINSGSTLLLASNFTVDYTLTVNSGGTLNIPNPYYTTGVGTTTISSGATLKTGHVQGVSTTTSVGCVQTTSRAFNSGASYVYNGTSPQVTGNAMTTVANLTFDNPNSVRLSQNLTISNGGTLTLTQGYHDLSSYTLTLGTSASANSLVHTAGGLYSKTNNGTFKRWMPSTTLTYNSGNYYGLFPFSKSSGQLGLVKISTTAAVVGGYIAISPTFGYDAGVSCSVTDGSNTIYRVQTGSFFTIAGNTVTGGTSITLQYDCGVYLSASGATASDLCLSTYTSSTVGIVGTHTSNAGSETSPQVRRTLTNLNLLTTNMVCVLGSHDASNTLAPQCNLGGTKTVGPGGDYTTLTAALTDVSDGGLASSLILELKSNYVSTSENYPLTIDPFNCLGSSNTLVIRPASGATNLLISDNSSTAVVSFDKGDYVTIDGRPGGTGSTSQLTIQNIDNSGPAILFDNGATYNCVKYVTIKGGQSGTSTGTIEFLNHNTTANNYDTITNCTIQYYSSNDIHKNAIYSQGESSTKDNTGNIITYNNLVDFKQAGIFLDANNESWTISNNHFYQTASITPGATMYGVHIVNDGSGYTISNNYIGGQSTSCGGSAFTITSAGNHYFPIYVSLTAGGSTNTCSIQGNTIRNIALSNTDGSTGDPGVFTGIYFVGDGAVNIGNVTGNIIGDTATSTSANKIAITSSASGGYVGGIIVDADGDTQIQNNLIGYITTSNNKGYVFYGIKNKGTGNSLISSNKIGSYSTSSTLTIGGASTGSTVCEFYGIYNSSTGTPIIQSNTIGNCEVYGTGASLNYGIYSSAGSSSVTISSNVIRSLKNADAGTNTSAYTVGIYQSGNIDATISSNLINSFTVNNGFFRGLYLNNTSGTASVTNNTIGSSTAGNISIASTSACTAFSTNVTANHAGIVVGASTPNCTFTSNTVRSIECTGSISYHVAGIAIGNGSSPIVNLSSNTIEKIGVSNTGSNSSNVYGAYSGSTTTTATTHQKNIIRNLYNRNTTSPSIYGFNDVTYNRSFINNFITIKNTDGTTSYTNVATLYGLYLNASSASKSAAIYYNTIEIGGSQSSGSNLSYAVYQNSSVSTTLVYTNNLIQNSRTGSSGIQYCYYGSSTTPTSTHTYNYFVAPSLTNFAYVGATKTSAQFLVAADDYGNTTSTGSTTAFTIASDASISDVSSLTPAYDLHLLSGCGEDINGTVGNRNSTSTAVHIGCYEGPVTIFYSTDVAANTDANSLSNWNSKTDASGVAPSNFTTSGYIFIIQSGHKYKATSSWTGNASGYIQVLDGGALDLNAQTTSTWGGIKINGTGISSSGSLLNSSSSALTCSIPITLESASTLVSSGSGGIILTGNVTNGGYTLTVDGTYNTSITTGVISGTGGITKEGSGTLTLSGTNTFTGITTINAGSIAVATIGNGGVAGNLGQATNSLSNIVLGGGTLKYTGVTASTDRAFSLTASTTSTIQIVSSSATLTISGNSGNSTSGALTKSGSGTLLLSGNNTYTGLTTISAGILKLGSAGSGSNTPLGTSGSGTIVSSGAALDLAGYSLVTSEAITISGTGVSSGGAIMNSGSSATFSGLITLGANSSIIGGSGSISISNVGTITGSGYNLTLGGAQGGTLTSILGTGSGGLTKQDAGTWVLPTANSYTGVTTISGGVLNIRNATALGTTAGGVTVASGAALELQGNISVGSESLTLNNDGVSSGGALRNVSGSNTWGGNIALSTNAVRINSDAGTLTLSGTITNGAVNITFGGAGNITTNGVLGSGTGNLTKDGAGTLTVGATNTYTGTTTVTNGIILLGIAQSLSNDVIITGTLNAAGYAISTSGNWTNNGTFTHGNNTVTLTGSSKTIGGSASTTFYNLVVNGSTALGVSTTVNNQLTLGSQIDIDAYDLTIGSSGIISGYSASNFIVTGSSGVLTQNGIASGSVTGKQIFPVGHTSTSYTPATINNIGTSDNFSVRIDSHHYADGLSGTISTTDKIDRTWVVSEAVAGGSNVTLTIQWNTAEELSGFDRTNCRIGHYTSGAWDTGSGTAASGSNPWTQSRSGITSFSPFDGEEGSNLPIKLLDFEARKQNKEVRLEWATASEENNDFFTVERSEDGIMFLPIGTKKGIGNSTNIQYYSMLDKKPLKGLSYYRLKQTDNDGKHSYSAVKSIQVDDQSDVVDMIIYPNPMLSNTLNIEAELLIDDSWNLQLYDGLGKNVYAKNINLQKGINHFTLDLPNDFGKGIYSLFITNNDGKTTIKKILK